MGPGLSSSHHSRWGKTYTHLGDLTILCDITDFLSIVLHFLKVSRHPMYLDASVFFFTRVKFSTEGISSHNPDTEVFFQQIQLLIFLLMFLLVQFQSWRLHFQQIHLLVFLLLFLVQFQSWGLVLSRSIC